jgi:histidine triad (HIT) family protein
VLIVPKTHIATFNDIRDDQQDILGEMYRAAQRIAREKGVAEKGYRVTVNVNPDGGQLIFHLHMHVFGGRKLTDAMG